MSSSLITAHGGSFSGLIHDTKINSPKDIKEKHLDTLVSKTTGVPMGKPVMAGVITRTLPDEAHKVEEVHKVPAKEVGKTKTKKMGQVAYQGPKY